MSPAPTTPSPFIRPRHAPVRGRDEVVEELLALVRRAVDGHGVARTLVGPAGIGKTSVLDEVIRRAGADSPTIRIVRIRGLEAEVEMAWSGLGGLLDGFLDRIGALPPARAAAIRGALAMADEGGPVEPFAVAVATRDLLAEAGQDAPILLVVDDVPWVDQPSRLVLGYVAEHVELEHLAVIGARRSDADASADLGAVVEIGALPDDAADELLADAGVTNADVRRRLRVAGGGNALVLVEAANLLDDDERSGRAALPDPLPVGTNGRRAAELAPGPTRPGDAGRARRGRRRLRR